MTASATHTRVLAVEEVSEKEAYAYGADLHVKMMKTPAVGEDGTVLENGIVASRVVPYKELDHATLELLFQNDPAFVLEKRPDWVAQFHPEFKN